MPMKYHIVQEEELLEKGSSVTHHDHETAGDAGGGRGRGGMSFGLHAHVPLKGLASPSRSPSPSHSHMVLESRLVSPAQSFAIKRVMNTVGVNPPLAPSSSVESLERCIHPCGTPSRTLSPSTPLPLSLTFCIPIFMSKCFID